jgi:hypothetical protein
MVLGPTSRLWLPYINLAIGSSALAFQTTVLYPWHHELDAAFHKQQKALEALKEEAKKYQSVTQVKRVAATAA